MAFNRENICPFISSSGSSCHHRFGEKDKKNLSKTICRFYVRQSQCPLYKLWKKQLENQFTTGIKKKRNTINQKMSGF